MTAIQTAPRRFRIKKVSFLVLRALLALAFVGAGIFKLSGHPAAVTEFDQVGFGQVLRYFTAALEIAGAVLLLWPRTIALGALLMGALLMGAVCAGAFFAQLLALHGNVVHTIVLALIFAAIAWRYRAQLALVR